MAAAGWMRPEHFVLDPKEERIVTFDRRTDEPMYNYQRRRRRSGFIEPTFGRFGGIKAGTLGGISLEGGVTIDRLPIPEDIVVREVTPRYALVEFTRDRKVWPFGMDNFNMSVVVEPTRAFTVGLNYLHIGRIQHSVALAEGVKQLYRGLPGMPSEVMDRIAGFTGARLPPHVFGGAEGPGGAVQPAYVNSNAGRRAAMIAKHEGAAGGAAGGAGVGGGGAAAAAGGAGGGAEGAGSSAQRPQSAKNTTRIPLASEMEGLDRKRKSRRVNRKRKTLRRRK